MQTVHVCLSCAVLCVALTPTVAAAANCACRCAVPMCRQICDVNCLRCCKCCVYFGPRLGRRSAANADDAAVTHCPRVHSHQRPDPAASMTASCRRARRRLSASTVLSVLLSSISQSWPELIVCRNTNDNRPTSLPDTFNKY